MSTKAIIWVIVAIVVVGGGAWLLTSNKGASDTGSEGAAGADSGTGTFAALMGLGGSKQCDVTVTTAQGPSTGIVYVSGTDVRSDIVATTPAGQIAAHMIKTGDTIYSWTDAYPQGVKMKVDASASTGGSAGAKGGYDPNAQVKYDCKGWTPDASKFAVPANVNFMDMSSGSAGVPGAMPIKGGTYPTPPAGTPNTY